MGTRALDRLLLDWIIKYDYDSVTLVGPNERDWLIRQLEGLDIEVDIIDSDPKFDNPRDAVFDEVTFNDLIVVCNAEKHYPIGKITKGNFIIVGDNDQHNGDCNPIDSFGKLIIQNTITTIKNAIQLDKWWIVYGNNVASA